LQRTRIGKATRAVSDNPALASASGIDVDRVISVVWVVGTALAGLSGVLLGLTQQVEYQMGLKVLLLVFAAVTLGGLGTIWGAMIGSIIVGIFIEVSTGGDPAGAQVRRRLGHPHSHPARSTPGPFGSGRAGRLSH
jgi:branched-chain amino acid transport system permease protein